MELVERVTLLEERFVRIRMLVTERRGGLLSYHSGELLELRKDAFTLIVKVAFFEERAKALAERLASLGLRGEMLGKRLEAFEVRLAAIETRLVALEQNIKALEKLIEALEKRRIEMDRRLDARLLRVEILQWFTLALLAPQALIFYLRMLTT
ncbi:hypothetical protein ACXZ1M_10080 [Duganella sp. PWIR1]